MPRHPRAPLQWSIYQILPPIIKVAPPKFGQIQILGTNKFVDVSFLRAVACVQP